MLDFQCETDYFSWSADSKYVAAPAEDRKAAYIFDVVTGERKARLEAADPIFSIQWLPDGKFLGSKSNSPPAGARPVRVWDFPSGSSKTSWATANMS